MRCMVIGIMTMSDYKPENLSDAVTIIRHSINTDRDMRNAWVASANSEERGA